MDTKTDRCPNCGYKVDSVSEIHGEPAKPTPGDFTLCLNCGALNRFDSDLMLKESTPEELSELSPTQFTEIRKAQAYIRERGIFT